MDLFSISQMSRYSGVKPHTIRMWEQRYQALQPHRSDGQTRYYDSNQLRRLLNIVSLIGPEHKVAALCRCSDRQLFDLVNSTISQTFESAGKEEYYISQLIAAGMSYDEQHFEKMYANCILRYGLRDGYVKVLYPMISRIGLMWTSNAIHPSSEHFICSLVRQKLFSAIDILPPPPADVETWLVFTREGERHEIGILLASYLVRFSGRKVVYLGCDVPFESLVEAMKRIHPSSLLTFMVHNDDPEISSGYLKDLDRKFKGNNIYIAGENRWLSDLKLSKRMHVLNSVEDLENVLKK